MPLMLRDRVTGILRIVRHNITKKAYMLNDEDDEEDDDE